MCAKTTKTNRSRLVGLRLTPTEYTQIAQQYEQSTCRKLSEYLRDRLFNQPITTRYRNQSIDDAMAVLMQYRTELNQVGNNLNQAVKKLHLLQQIPEFKTWLSTNEPLLTDLHQHLDTIQTNIRQMGKQWLQ